MASCLTHGVVSLQNRVATSNMFCFGRMDVRLSNPFTRMSGNLVQRCEGSARTLGPGPLLAPVYPAFQAVGLAEVIREKALRAL